MDKEQDIKKHSYDTIRNNDHVYLEQQNSRLILVSYRPFTIYLFSLVSFYTLTTVCSTEATWSTVILSNATLVSFPKSAKQDNASGIALVLVLKLFNSCIVIMRL